MDNQYQYTRSIGFVLKGNDLERLSPESSSNLNEVCHKDLEDLVCLYKKLLNDFKIAVFETLPQNRLKVKYTVELKWKWLKLHAKEEYYGKDLNQSKIKKYTIKEAPFLEGNFLDWLDRNESLMSDLEKIASCHPENKTRLADLSFIIRKISSVDYHDFVKNFVTYANDKKESVPLNNLRGTAVEFGKRLEELKYALAYTQSKGLEIARASFNFYTINKTSKYLDTVLQEKKKTLDSPFEKLDPKDSSFLKRVGFIDYLKQKHGVSGCSEISINNLYDGLKDFKSIKKKKFVEAVNQGLQKGADDLELYLEKNFPIFGDRDKDRDKIKNYIKLTRNIKNLAEERNKALSKGSIRKASKIKEEIKSLKKKRGKLFQKHGFSYYAKYCNSIFKTVAVERGKLKAEILALKEEKIESRLLKYWACILKQDEKKYIVLIPKTHISKAKKWMETLDDLGKSELVIFNSITLRALNKLIRKNYEQKVPNLNKADRNTVSLYKSVLSGRLSRIVLDFSGFESEINEIANRKYDKVDDFRRDLETVAYACKEISISEEKLEILRSRYKAIILEITSYDLERNLRSPEREHTKLWKSCWTKDNIKNYFPTRINPEVRLFYRKYQDLPIKKQRNRFSKEHFRVQFTITENAGQAEIKSAFASEQDLQKSIEMFYEEVVKQWMSKQGTNLWYYGIDRGNQELATLGLVRWTKGTYRVKLSDDKMGTFKIPKFPNIEVYQIKNQNATKKIQTDTKGTKKTVKIIDNPSYFIDDIDLYFGKKEVSFLDLTTAKCIKGKIILDGDVKTYINLKKANGKRKLFESFSQIREDARVEYSDEKFVVKLKDEERHEYLFLTYFTLEQGKRLGIEMKKDIENTFQNYLNELREDPTANNVSIKQINNLRDAITSNMVGIIAHLFEMYPGVIALENLCRADHFDKNNENIERRLEWALYRKFQKIGLVPPKLKQTILLREKMKMSHLGIIHFVKTSGTSANCPYCGNKADTKKRKESKWREHHYLCTNKNCMFSTKNNRKSPLERITNSDDVASYNIAKSSSEFA